MNDRPLVSILLPSRDRPALLRRCVKSILENTARPERLQFIIRWNDGDYATQQEVTELARGHTDTCRFSIGGFGGEETGYDGLCDKYFQCAQAATGRWLLLMADDGGFMPADTIIVKGRQIAAWDDILASIQVDNVIIGPEFNHWQNVFYGGQHHARHFLMVPNHWWEQYGLTGWSQNPPHGVDTWLMNTLTGEGFNGPGFEKSLKWKSAIITNWITFHSGEPRLS